MASPLFSSTLSREMEHRDWDDFLAAQPAGVLFAQTSMWAQTKAAEGWQTLRLLFHENGRLVGGVQTLWKQKRGLRIGYVSKGPVLAQETPANAAQAMTYLRDLARRQRIAFLIIQPPDPATAIPDLLATPHFLPNCFGSVISANLVVDLRAGRHAVEKGMRRSTRQEARRATRQGVTIREGGLNQIPLFFDMMLATCRRLKTHPNPADVDSLIAMWQAFEPRGCIRLTLAEHHGQPVAGLLSIMFGHSVTFWKKGSHGTARSYHADQALIHEGIAWACHHGFSTCDFASMARSAARARLEGQPLPETIRSTRDFLHLGFGGEPMLLPPARVYISNPVLRWGYRIWSGIR